MGFVDSLRMNSIYPGAGGNSSTFGPPTEAAPNVDAIARIMNLPLGNLERNRDAEWEHENNVMAQQHRDRLSQIAASMSGQQQEANKPMNVVMAPNAISPLDKAKLDLQNKDLNRKTAADKNNLNIKQQGEDTKQQRADTAQQRADTYHSIMDRRDLTDSQKLTMMNDARMKQIGAHETSQTERTKLTNDQKTSDTKVKQEGANKRQEMRDDTSTANVMSRGEQARETKAMPGTDKPISPGQQNVDTNNKAKELFNTRPDLAPYIKFDDKGNVRIKDDGSLQASEVKSKVYGRTNDINLPNESKKSQDEVMEKPIPGTNKKAISTDGGVTWKAK